MPHARWLFALTLLLTLPAAASEPPPFGLAELAGWETLDAAGTTPYVREGLRSEFLYGARSPRGSWIFVTRIDNTLELPAFSAGELETMSDVRTFADLEPRDFRTEIVEVRAPDQAEVPTVPSLARTFRTDHLTYGAGGGETVLVRTVFVPVVLWHAAAQRYDNLIYVANFRGAPRHTGDLERFERLWSHLELAPGAALVAPHRFNACRPELVQRRRTPR